MSARAGTPPAADGGPTVLRSLVSAILLDRRGDLELARETRGAPIEWGGVYGQLVRLTGPWRLVLEAGDLALELPPSRADGRVDGERFTSTHRAGPLAVQQEVVPLVDVPGGLRTLTLASSAREPLRVVLTSTFEPFLLPVLVEGIRPIDFRLETHADELRVRHRGFGLAYRASVPPSRLYVDRGSWRGGHRRGPVREIGSDHELRLEPGVPQEVRWSIVGGLERDLDRGPRTDAVVLPRAAEVAGDFAEAERTWADRTPVLRFPDAPELERAYAAARSMLRRLYVSPGDGLTGLVAGYPWYAAIWCRDLAWMLPAVIWLGDFGWAEASIASVLRFQASHDVPLVGAEPGELPMQIAPGPIFLFGTSDTTLYFPALVRRLVRHRGDRGLPAGWSGSIVRAIAWGERRTDPGTGLLRNGGEVAALSATTRGIARVRYGIDAVDTTIWDSADRRDHAIDVQVLWYEALRAALDLEEVASGAGGPDRLAGLADRLRTAIRGLYPWPAESYLYDSLRAGAPVAQLRPNALRAVSAGLLDPPLAAAVVRRASADDLTTDWGMRTLSSRDPGYSPTAYHGGQVWTIATAWAADAALALGQVDLGLGYLERIASCYREEGGGANECYRGDRAEPYNSCFALGLSVAPFLAVLFERLWGLDVDARRPFLAVRPRFPAGWRSASIERLRVGEGEATVRFADGRLELAWNGARPLTVEGPAGDHAEVAPGGRAVLRLP